MKFCKHLWILALPLIANATQVSIPYSFSAGQKIVASQMNSNFNAIVGVVNGNIASDNIAVGGIATSSITSGAITNTKIANDAVTTSKILDLAVTTDKIADNAVTAAKFNISSNIASSNTVQVSIIAHNVVGEFATASITTSGKPLYIGLQPGKSQSGYCSSATENDGISTITLTTGSGDDWCSANVILNIDGVDVATQRVMGFSSSGGTGEFFSVSPSQFQHVQAGLSSGAHTIKAKLRPGGGSVTCSASIQCTRLVAYELY